MHNTGRAIHWIEQGLVPDGSCARIAETFLRSLAEAPFAPLSGTCD